MAEAIPAGDAEFNAFSCLFVQTVLANPAAYGETPASVIELRDSHNRWQTSYRRKIDLEMQFRAALVNKDGDRLEHEALLRRKRDHYLANDNVTDAALQQIHIIRGGLLGPLAPAPKSRPLLHVNMENRLRHVIHFRDDAAANGSRKPAKPEGVNGAEIYYKIEGAPPADVNDCKFLALDTKSPYSLDFEEGDGGKLVHYMARWVNARQEPGPWSRIVSATVTG